ncbi:MFS general substrate transporter [Aspergillus ellipticus CBS 707.79]|uniref:MFS general substrate transporter n=1 Tax=Aspergillus ellipticus CBS 707.79 TaxID=1448320 RepID=A0A319DFI8_9EURO|nr:MFS general substrate transporter [Aspergillus ellipticus CBS 707.79]PYH96084.1 MFS general substrate transporter [Aspergillus ellipticus CBS 707.79]
MASSRSTEATKNSNEAESESRILQIDEPDELPAATLTGWRLHTVQFCLLFGLMLSVMDGSVVSTALVTIGNYFNDFRRIQWVVLSYLLAYLAFTLILPRISDIIGRKWAVITSLVILTAASIGCGCSQTLEQLIAFRALQGIGGSGLYSLALIVIIDITPDKKIPLISGLLGVVFTVASVLAPMIGGGIRTHSTWRWVFWFNVPCGGFATILMLLACPTIHTPGTITWRQLDVLGCALYLAASVLAILALQEAGEGTFDWDSAAFIVCIIVAGLAFCALVAWIALLSRKKRSIAPLFPTRILGRRAILATILTSTLNGYVFYTVLIELPERFQIVNHKTPRTAGIYLLAMSGASAIGSGLGGFLASKYYGAFFTLNGACGFVLLGAGLLSTIGFNPSIPGKLFGYEVLIGFGFGIIFSTSVMIVKMHSRPKDSASAQGLVAQSRVLGGNIGLAIATVILNQHLVSDMQGTLSDSQIDDLRHSLTATRTLDPHAVEAVRASFADAFHSQMEVSMYIAAAALVAGLCTWQRYSSNT